MTNSNPAHAAFIQIEGTDNRLLFLCDHASNALPEGVSLGVPDAVLADHMGYDLGAADLTIALAAHFGGHALLGRWSRLLVDLNRPPELSVPERSDGFVIPGNVGLEDAALRHRLALHADFHDAIHAHVRQKRPQLIVSIHSFTPALASAPAPRPWPVALLWNEDIRATIPALAALHAEPGLPGPVGENQPYSGKVLNYTMDRHAEAHGIAYLGYEVRQDMLADKAGVGRWADIIARSIAAALKAAPWES